MIHSARFICVLDTNVIFPIEIRDLLFWLASYDLYTPRWSDHIFDEWVKVMHDKGVSSEVIQSRTAVADAAFPDARVENYALLIDSLELPDPKDRHVLAAAIKTNANVIVTNNLKDFPADYLAMFGLIAKSADDFIADVIDLNPEMAVKAFRELVVNRRNPDLDEFEVLDRMRNNGLKDAANFIHAML